MKGNYIKIRFFIRIFPMPYFFPVIKNNSFIRLKLGKTPLFTKSFPKKKTLLFS